MLLRGNQKRALKGFIESEVINSRKLYFISGIIFMSFLVSLCIINIIMTSTGQMSSSNGGALTTGFGIATVFMIISAITMTVGKDIRNTFIFPIDRKTYVLGNFIMFIINIIGLLLFSSLAYIVEFAIFKLLGIINSNIIYLNSMKLEVFLYGLWVSFCYILFLTTLTYLVFMLFARFKKWAVIIFLLGIGLSVVFTFGREVYVKIVLFFVSEQSILLLSLKLFISAIVFQFLSYLAIRKMEVNN